MILNKYIDHTNLSVTATKKDIKKLCDEAKKYNFYSVCVYPYYVEYCQKQLENTDIKVGTVIGFPSGATLTPCKCIELENSLIKGATEFDFVVSILAIKNGDFDYVNQEFKKIKQLVPNYNVKAILETCLLSDEEIKKVTQLAIHSGIDFVKTSTGFSKYGAKIEHVKLMKNKIQDNNKTKIKASGGIRNLEQALAFINAGAERIGTSNGVNIMEEWMQKNK